MDLQYKRLAYHGLFFPSLNSWINTYTSCKTQLNYPLTWADFSEQERELLSLCIHCVPCILLQTFLSILQLFLSLTRLRFFIKIQQNLGAYFINSMLSTQITKVRIYFLIYGQNRHHIFFLYLPLLSLNIVTVIVKCCSILNKRITRK